MIFNDFLLVCVECVLLSTFLDFCVRTVFVLDVSVASYIVLLKSICINMSISHTSELLLSYVSIMRWLN